MKLVVAFLIVLLLFVKPIEAMPVWSQNQESVPSSSQYSPGKFYNFQINWSGSNESYTVSSVWFESNFTGTFDNKTATNISNIYKVNFTDLKARVYAYRWYAVDNESNENATDQFVYIVSKNNSVIRLYLNGTESNKEYDLNKIANFTAFLNISNRTIYLDSNYTGFVLQNSSTSLITNLTNLTSPGIFSITAYWNGDENYSASSQTYYFDNIPPQYLTRSEYPFNPAEYNPNMDYVFGSNWNGINISRVLFESNFSGYYKNYSAVTTPSVQNNSNSFSILIPSLPAETFLYRWIAFNSLNKATNSTKYEYDILKGLPLLIEVTPSKTVLIGTKTTVICRSATNQVPVSNFKLFRNNTLIANDTSSTRRDDQVLGEGVYEYVCNCTETQNFTAQASRVTLTISSNITQPTIPKPLALSGPSSIQLNLGESAEENFFLENNLGQSISNITLVLTGISSNWYKISELPTSIPDNFSLLIRINFSIPTDAEQGNYTVTVRAIGKTNETKVAIATTNLTVTTAPPPQNYPPVYSTSSTNTTSSGYEFSLKWDDDSGLSGYIFSSNTTGNWTNDSWTPFSGTESWSYIIKNISQANEVIAWKVYANDSNNLWTESEEFYLKITKTDMILPIAIVSAFVICLAAFLLFITRKSKSKTQKKENVLYIYRKDDLK